MAELTETEALVLTNIIYEDSFMKIKIKSNKSVTVLDWAEDFEIDSIAEDNIPAEMNREQFGNIIATIKNNPERYGKLDIKNVTNEEYTITNKKTGKLENQSVTSAALDFEDDVIIVFKGTGGDKEWRGNGIGAYLETFANEQDELALAWMDRYLAKNPQQNKGLQLVGHSAGAKKAAHIAFQRGELIQKAFCFDGPGFNKTYFLYNQEKIDKYKNKIHEISLATDYVNILLNDVADNKKYIISSTCKNEELMNSLLQFGFGLTETNISKVKSAVNEIVDKFKIQHSPYFLFDESNPDNLVINQETAQVKDLQYLQGLLNYYEIYMDVDDFNYLVDKTMSCMLKSEIDYPVSHQQMPKGFMERIINLTAGYVSIKEQEDPKFAGRSQILLPGLGIALGISNFKSIILGDINFKKEIYRKDIRDYRQTTKDKLLALTERQEDIIWQVPRSSAYQEVGYLIESWGFEGFQTDALRLNNFYEDIEKHQAKSKIEFNRIFTEVGEAERELCGVLDSVLNEMKNIKKGLQSVQAKIYL